MTDCGSFSTGLPAVEINSIAIDPITPTTIYVGTNGYGVYKTIDGGDNWSSVGLLYYIYALAIDPNNTDIIYAAQDTGIHKSVDGGANWSTTGMTGNIFHGLAIDPTNTNIIYGACIFGSNGLYRTDDGGANWIGVGPGGGGFQAHDVIIDPANHTTIYIGHVWGILKSTDSGNSPVSKLSGPSIRKIAIQGSVLYAVGETNWDANPPANGAVFRSSDSGESWTASFYNPYARVRALAIHPLDVNTVYVGVYDSSVFISIDACANWSVYDTLSRVNYLVATSDGLLLISGGRSGVNKCVIGTITTQAMSVIQEALISNVCNYYDA